MPVCMARAVWECVGRALVGYLAQLRGGGGGKGLGLRQGMGLLISPG